LIDICPEDHAFKIIKYSKVGGYSISMDYKKKLKNPLKEKSP